jgi:hypothetical protein
MIHPTTKNKNQFYCKKCNKWKNKEDWYYTKKTKKDSMCKSCRKEYRKDAKNLHMKNYYIENKEHYLELHRKWRENNLEKKLWYSCKNNAARKNIDFEIKPSDIIIPEICPVLGIPLDTHAESGVGTGYDWKLNPFRPSVDRIDSKKGYTKDNISVISWRANTLKSDGTLEELKKICEWLEKIGDSH